MFFLKSCTAGVSSTHGFARTGGHRAFFLSFPSPPFSLARKRLTLCGLRLSRNCDIAYRPLSSNPRARRNAVSLRVTIVKFPGLGQGLQTPGTSQGKRTDIFFFPLALCALLKSLESLEKREVRVRHDLFVITHSPAPRKYMSHCRLSRDRS